MSIVEDFQYSDEEIDEKKHQKLLDKVLSLNKVQQLKKPSRTEPTLKISEFDLVKSLTGKKGSVHVDDLTKVLDKKKAYVNIKKKVDTASKISRTLPKPLEKPTADRIQRTVAYEKTRLELDRWEPIITSNRVSTDLVFPLPSSKGDEKEDLASKWRLKTIFDLEMEKTNPPKIEEIHVDLERDKFSTSMKIKEIMEHKENAAKMRAHQTYKEAKARRQNKIKSKKYHRIQRREKIKQQLKEFELLQKTDPEEALKKLEEIEKIRAYERFSLRHKSTGKWAKNKQIRAKYDKESRQELAQQLTLSKELTQKVNAGSDSEDDFFPVEEEVIINSSDKDNLWSGNIKVDKEVTDFVEGYKKFWLEKTEKSTSNNEEVPQESENKNLIIETQMENNALENIQENKEENDLTKSKNALEGNRSKNKKSKKLQPKKKRTKNLDNSLSTSEWDVETFENNNIDAVFDKLEKKLGNKLQKKLKNIQCHLKSKHSKRKNKQPEDEEKKSLLALPISKKRPKIDEPLSEKATDENSANDGDLNDLKSILEKKDGVVEKKKPNESNIDPNKFKNMKVTHLDTEIPDSLTNIENDDEMEGDSCHRELIDEALEDDDLLEEFAKEKSDDVTKNKPQDINLTLPGWGSWGGTGIVPSKRKRRRFIIKAPKKVPRRDDNKGFLIINEDASNRIKEHMVDELPFPFQRVRDFEASIRAPIGRTFVPETAFRKLTKPAIKTQMGAIIEPMDINVLLKKSS